MKESGVGVAVTFDLDGTLVDLRAVYVRAHQTTAREVLGRELEEAHVLELMKRGLPIRAHWEHFDASAADRLVEVFIEQYRLERQQLARPFPGMLRILAAIREAGVPTAVVTSKLRADALAELGATGLLEMFGAVIAFEDTETHKPDAAPHQAALRALDATTGVGVGDLPSDIASACAAGMAAIGVCWGYGTRKALVAAGAANVCDTVEQLETELWRYLEQWPRHRQPL